MARVLAMSSRVRSSSGSAPISAETVLAVIKLTLPPPPRTSIAELDEKEVVVNRPPQQVPSEAPV